MPMQFSRTKTIFRIIALLVIAAASQAQEFKYQTPPKAIQDILLAQQGPEYVMKLISGEVAYDDPGVVQAYQNLPDQFRDTLAITCIYVTALQRSDDTNAYKRALQDAAIRLNSPSFQFMLVDLPIG